MAKRHTTVNGRPVQKSHLVWNAYRPENPVRDGEVIHHINGDPEDNRAENLVKMTLAEHEALHSRERWSDPAMRQKILDAQRDGRRKPAARKLRSEIAIKLWADPEYRKKMAEARKRRTKH